MNLKIYTLPKRRYPLVCLLFLLFSHLCNGQFEENYYPRKTYSASSKELISDIESNLVQEASRMEKKAHPIVQKINSERLGFMRKMIKNQAFIKDDSLETYVKQVINRIVAENALPSFPRYVLIAKSAYVNAFCFGEGIYVVTISLLGRIANENQLAFVMAHEIAHDELGHIREEILKEAEINLAKRTKEQINKIINGSISLEDIEEYRAIIYGVSKYSRKKELQADSMALKLLQRAKYNDQQALSVLPILGATQVPKYDIGIELFLPFHTNDYPFQDYWLNERLSLFKRKHTGDFMGSSDSLESHPEIKARTEEVNSFPMKNYDNRNGQSLAFVNAVTGIAEFETVESAYKSGAYDLCMYYALQLLSRFPKNAYLTSRIGKVLIDLIEEKVSISRYTTYYSDELRLVNNFLLNLTPKERSEVAFHFLSNKTYFNPKEKSHYYLLWKISDLTYRYEVKEKMKRDYSQAFGKGIGTYQYK